MAARRMMVGHFGRAVARMDAMLADAEPDRWRVEGVLAQVTDGVTHAGRAHRLATADGVLMDLDALDDALATTALRFVMALEHLRRMRDTART